jgi:hypothetical protein
MTGCSNIPRRGGWTHYLTLPGDRRGCLRARIIWRGFGFVRVLFHDHGTGPTPRARIVVLFRPSKDILSSMSEAWPTTDAVMGTTR